MELAIVLMMLLILVAIAAIKLNEQGVSFPFKRKTQLFTPVEHSFLQLLETAVGHQYRVICRVKLNDILTLRHSTKAKQGKAALARAAGRQLDFVLCSRDDMSPVVAIDLVHNNGKDGYKTQRDWFVSGALDASRIPHLRIKVKSGYTPEDIRECIEAKLAPHTRKLPKKPLVSGTKADSKRPTRPIRSNRPIAA